MFKLQNRQFKWIILFLFTAAIFLYARNTYAFADTQNNYMTLHNCFAAQDNSAPSIINTAPGKLPDINEEDETSSGISVSELLNGKVSGSDISKIGIAVIAADKTHGNWEYTTDGSQWWTMPKESPDVSEGSALLLTPGTKIRFTPAADFNGNVPISFRLWDGTAGASEGRADVTVNGGNTAFSSDIGTASVNVIAVNDPPSIKRNLDNSVIKFDGALNHYVSVPDMHLNSSFTFESWVYADAANSYSRIFDFGGGESINNQWLGFNGVSGKIEFELWNGSIRDNSHSITTSDVFPIGKWIHVTAVYDSPNKMAYIYWNGVLKASGPMNISDAQVERACSYFGRSNWTEDAAFKGSMYGMVVFNSVRSQVQIQADMNRNFNAAEPNLVAYYPISEKANQLPTATTVTDIKGDHTGSLVGATIADKSEFTYYITGLKNSSINVNSIKIEDVDVNEGTMELSLSVQHGTLNIGNMAGVTVTSGANNSPAIKITGTITSINNALSSLVYQPSSDYIGSDEMPINISDMGNTGSGGALTDSKTAEINVVSSDSSISDACDVTGIVSPATAAINGTDITASADSSISSLTVNAAVSSGASWKLYTDALCTNEAADKTVNINAGQNVFYIKVTAQDGISIKTYKLTINKVLPEGMFEISYDSNGGNTVSDSQVTSGSTIATGLPVPTKSGYVFGGWYKDDTCTNAWDYANDKVTANTTLHAKWIADSHTDTTSSVNFNSINGSTVSSITTGNGITINAPNPAPTREGYTFGGWYKDQSYSSPWNFTSDKANSDTVLYAKWTANVTPPLNYTVNFMSDGTVLQSVSVAAGNGVSAPTVPTKNGYTFGGWYKDQSYSSPWDFVSDKVNNNTVLYAKWTANTPPPQGNYTIGYDSSGGNTVADSQVTSGSTITTGLPVPAKAGYVFGGWYKDDACTNAWDYANDKVTANTTLHAKWIADSHTDTTSNVSFNSINGSTVSNVTTGSGITINAPNPAPTREGYTFGGWYKDQSYSSPWNFVSDKANSDTVLYAKWTANVTPPLNYTVSFMSDGTVLQSVSVAAGNGVSAPTVPTKNGYTFGGWYKDQSYSSLWDFVSDKVNNNTVLYAKWTANTTPPQLNYTVSFMSDGAVFQTASVAPGNSVSVPSVPGKANYIFGGWYIDQVFTVPWDFANNRISSNIILYAKWTYIQPSNNNGNSHDHGNSGGSGTGNAATQGNSQTVVQPQPVSSQGAVTSGTINAAVIDSTTGQPLKLVPVQEVTAADGTKTVTVKSQDLITIKQHNGIDNALSSFSGVSISSAADGQTPDNTAGGRTSASLRPDGTIEVSNLAKGTSSNMDVQVDLGNGQKISIGTIKISVDQNGEVKMVCDLVDPYGTITDDKTGNAVAGAKVTLYYADTKRNNEAGKLKNTVVALPYIDSFKPNSNGNPQISDALGAYGFMVYPNTDYYVTAEKEGYDTYKSSVVSVEKELVKLDFKMTASKISNASEPVVSSLTANIDKSTVKNKITSEIMNNAKNVKVGSYAIENGKKVSSIVIATSEGYADSTVGKAIAGMLNGKLHLVKGSSNDSDAAEYIRSNLLTGGKVYILGGKTAVSSGIEKSIVKLGIKPVRIGGKDRFETAYLAAKKVKHVKNEAVIVTSCDSKYELLDDAVNGSCPIIYTNKNVLNQYAKKALKTIKPKKIYVVGDEKSINKTQINRISKLLKHNKPEIIWITDEKDIMLIR